MNDSPLLKKSKAQKNGSAPHQRVFKNTVSAKSNLCLLGFSKSQCANNWNVHTSALGESTHIIRGQDLKEMYKNENTVVLRVVGLGAIVFPKRSFFLLYLLKSYGKINSKASSPS